MRNDRDLDSVEEEIHEITKLAKKAKDKFEETAEALGELYREDKRVRWLLLQQQAQKLMIDVEIALNKRLKPLQAEYAKAWNRKWR